MDPSKPLLEKGTTPSKFLKRWCGRQRNTAVLRRRRFFCGRVGRPGILRCHTRCHRRSRLGWDQIVLVGMTDGKAKPPIRCFRKVMDGGPWVRGFLRDGIVYINEDLATGTSLELRQTVLEEVAHDLTNSKDETRDLQDWAFKLAVKVAMARASNSACEWPITPELFHTIRCCSPKKAGGTIRTTPRKQ